jgi:hypothetical protein
VGVVAGVCGEEDDGQVGERLEAARCGEAKTALLRLAMRMLRSPTRQSLGSVPSQGGRSSHIIIAPHLNSQLRKGTPHMKRRFAPSANHHTHVLGLSVVSTPLASSAAEGGST